MISKPKNMRNTVLILMMAALLSACGAPKPPVPSGERIPINGIDPTSLLSEICDQYDDPVYRN